MNRNSTLIIALLIVVIILLTWLLIVKQAEAPTVQPSGATTTGTTVTVTPTPPAPTGALHERVQLTTPKANATVSHKFTITGKAPGNWFFEASAPYMIQTEDGSKIAQGQIQATEDWMTTNLVAFKADVSVNTAYTGPATLVLLKDNPSGLPENEDSLEIPITIQ